MAGASIQADRFCPLGLVHVVSRHHVCFWRESFTKHMKREKVFTSITSGSGEWLMSVRF